MLQAFFMYCTQAQDRWWKSKRCFAKLCACYRCFLFASGFGFT